jgi:hypothetical protein
MPSHDAFASDLPGVGSVLSRYIILEISHAAFASGSDAACSELH